AKESEMDYAMGIHSGGDDYLTKPFKPSLLTMRIKSLFRRIEMERASLSNEIVVGEFSFGDLTLEETKRQITVKEKVLELTPTEFSLMSYMIKNKERPVSREELLNSLWGYTSEVETRVTDETVRRIRKKLIEMKSRVQIKTEWGFGYRLVIPEEDTNEKS
ncbi:MAG: response regulator transcription factor, partial [Gallicola sp.]|nr:response regulator transcription factor [Gallicola sp.]